MILLRIFIRGCRATEPAALGPPTTTTACRCSEKCNPLSPSQLLAHTPPPLTWRPGMCRRKAATERDAQVLVGRRRNRKTTANYLLGRCCWRLWLCNAHYDYERLAKRCLETHAHTTRLNVE
uniref:Putative secreted protein n=1 Tax=Anopheles darlingi TaxID=43151 RepID=A0A2M4DM19_ANODA